MRKTFLFMLAALMASTSYPTFAFAEKLRTKKKQLKIFESQQGLYKKDVLKAALRCFKGGEFLWKASNEQDVFHQVVILKASSYDLEELVEAWKAIQSWYYTVEIGNELTEGVFNFSPFEEIAHSTFISPLGDYCLKQTFSQKEHDGSTKRYELFLMEGKDFTIFLSSIVSDQDSLDADSQAIHDSIINALTLQNLTYKKALSLIEDFLTEYDPQE